jgi:hypothetical protein
MRPRHGEPPVRRERQAHVSLGFTLTIDVTLTVAAQREAIAVYGAFDRHSAAVSQSFDSSQLAFVVELWGATV